LPLRGCLRLNQCIFRTAAMLLFCVHALAQTGGQPGPAEATSSEAYEGLTVQSISFVGIANPNSGSLLQLIAQKSGEPLNRERVRESIRALYATGRFADIRSEIERMAGHSALLNFVLIPNYFVGEVRAEGEAARPSANQIVNASKLQLGEVLAPEKIERALTNIRQLMEQEGYYHSEIQEQEKNHPDTQQVDVLFNVRPGEQARVGQVLVTGNPGFSQGQIQDTAKMHPGDEISVQLISRALDRIQKKYQKQSRLLAQVTITKRVFRPAVNRVDYTFNIEPGPRVYISAEGFKISRTVLKRNVPVYEENAVDDDLLNEGRRNLIGYMQKRGYFDAKVSYRKISNSSNEFRVLYVIDPDGRHRLVRLELTGNKYFTEEDLRDRLQIQVAGRLLSHGRYSQDLLNRDVRDLQALYKDNGFEHVKVTSTVFDNYQGRENDLDVKISIDEGPQSKVLALKIVGNETIPEDQFPALNVVPGQPFSQASIAADREIVLNHYLNRGYPDATFEASASPPDEQNRVAVTYTVYEGQQVFVDRVIVSGLENTRPFVVQREIRMKPGDPLSQVRMLETQKNLYDLGIFSQVDTAVQNPDGKARDKNVLVDLQEARRYTFNYGIGLEFQTGQPSVGTNQPLGSTGVSPRVSFGVTRLNLRGRNHTVSFKANVGRLQQRGLFSYDAPRWFNSPDWRLTFTTFYDNTVDVTTFTSQRLEGSVQAEQIVSRRADGSPATLIDYKLTYRRVRASDLQISPNQVPLLSLPTRVGIPNISYIRNRRDNDLESTRGSYTTLDAGVADSHLASEVDFGRALVQNSTYFSFNKKGPSGKSYVLARSTRLGIEQPFGNTFMPFPGEACPAAVAGESSCLPLAERFFSGGGNSHRGFGLNQAGPRDPFTGFPLGGTALFLNNLELRFPPATLPFVQDNIGFVIFHDAGNIFTNSHELFHNLLRWRQKDPALCMQDSTALQCDYSYVSHAIGVGVRYKTPIGPVRFDFGYNLNPPAFPSCQSKPRNPSDPVSSFCSSADSAAPFFVPQKASHFNVYFSIGQTF
jgi:outer membrane protein insertion porin family